MWSRLWQRKPLSRRRSRTRTAVEQHSAGCRVKRCFRDKRRLRLHLGRCTLRRRLIPCATTARPNEAVPAVRPRVVLFSCLVSTRAPQNKGLQSEEIDRMVVLPENGNAVLRLDTGSLQSSYRNTSPVAVLSAGRGPFVSAA